jgi:hypothetical protein
MGISSDLAPLFQRDLTRLVQQLQAFPSEDILWKSAPGISNTAGNLVLHLEGNLREYIGRQLGNLPYRRERDQEFARKEVPVADLISRTEDLGRIIPAVIAGLSDHQLQATYPEKVLGRELSTQQFLIHLHGHFNYHLGQIDYLRRILTEGATVQYAGL